MDRRAVDGIQLITDLADWLYETSEVADISVHTGAAGEIVLSVTIRPPRSSPLPPYSTSNLSRNSRTAVLDRIA